MSIPKQKHFRVRLIPGQLEFDATAGEPILDAAKRWGISVRAACRNGVCEICAGTLMAGEAHDSRRNLALAREATVLLCRAEARGNLVIQIEGLMPAGGHPMESVTARVIELTPLNHDVFQVTLRLPPGRAVPYHAGQYLAIMLPGAEPAWFSIAGAPGTDVLELHIQAASDWVTAQGVMDYLREQGQVPLQLPFGRACLAQRPERELLLVAAGTGFAQMKSILDFLHSVDTETNSAAASRHAPISLYWGVRRHEDMYLRDLPERWHDAWPEFRFVPVVSNDEDSEWQGHHDQLARVVLAAGHDLSQATVIASGSPVMVYTLMDALVEAGLPADQFLSDVLEYAPR